MLANPLVEIVLTDGIAAALSADTRFSTSRVSRARASMAYSKMATISSVEKFHRLVKKTRRTRRIWEASLRSVVLIVMSSSKATKKMTKWS